MPGIANQARVSLSLACPLADTSGAMTNAKKNFEDVYFTVRDGLRLYARHYPPTRDAGLRPVLCLPGLTRNSRDFHDIATVLSAHPTTPRDVFTLDMRGRGLSEHDRSWRNYAIPVEMQDVIDFMTMIELSATGIIGTSRGGIIAHALAAAQPARVGPVVLNDIGPVIDFNGLVRIASYVGRIPVPKTWQEATRIVLELTRRDFPTLTEADAEAFARQSFNEKDGHPISGYDAKLAKCLSILDGPIPTLWPQFEALKRVPVFIVRGANSDLLSRETVEQMRLRHPQLTKIEVPDQGHAPFLRDKPTIDAIAAFFAETDLIGRRIAA
jgi:pimeloyl-ACP methyl ester carboxylesterase